MGSITGARSNVIKLVKRGTLMKFIGVDDDVYWEGIKKLMNS